MLRTKRCNNNTIQYTTKLHGVIHYSFYSMTTIIPPFTWRSRITHTDLVLPVISFPSSSLRLIFPSVLVVTKNRRESYKRWSFLSLSFYFDLHSSLLMRSRNLLRRSLAHFHGPVVEPQPDVVNMKSHIHRLSINKN